MNFFDLAVEKTLELLSVNSVQNTPCANSPFGEGVAKCLRFVEDWAKAEGFKTFCNGYYTWAEIGDGDLFGILGHVDTVPFEGDWSANPLGEIKDGKIYGRGVLDDKGPMMLALYAVISLLKEGKIPKRRIRFIFGGNEESGWKCIDKYLEKEEIPKEGISPDGDFPVINLEKGVVNIETLFKKPKSLISFTGGVRANIVIDECSAVVNEVLPKMSESDFSSFVKNGKTYINAFGKPAHGSTPQKGDNAAWKILKFLKENSKENYEGLKRAICHTDGSGINIKSSDEISGALTANAGIVNVKGDMLSVVFDIRYPLCENTESINNKIAQTENVTGTKILHFHKPHFVEKDSSLICNLLNAYNKVTGENAEPISIGGATYARAIPQGVAFGPIFPDMESTIHQKNEYVSLSDFRKIYDIYYEAFKNILFN